MRDIFLKLLYLALPLALLVSCSENGLPDDEGNDDEAKASARSTLLVYMMAENNLDSFAKKDLAEIFLAAKDVPADCDMLVFLDGISTPCILRYYAEKGKSACDTVYRFKNDFYSSDAKELQGVLDYIFEEYPTESLNLVLWSHGSGWMKFNKAKSRSIGYDNGENSPSFSLPSKSCIDIKDLAKVLGGLSVPIEYLMFDACLMQCIEVVYDLRYCCKYILASPAEIPANGAPYDRMIKEFFKAQIDPYALMMSYADGYPTTRGVLLSVIECVQIDQFAETMGGFVPKYFNAENKINTSNLFVYLNRNYKTMPEFFDMNGVAKNVFAPEDYEVWKSSLDKMIVCSFAADSWETMYSSSYVATTDRAQFCGVSMYLPIEDSKHSSFNDDFVTIDWYKVANWDIAGW